MRKCAWTLCVLWSAVACAADYYVDVAHPKASGENPGTQEAPWKTIQRAADVARYGDTVHVAPGIYPESVHVRDSFPNPKDKRKPLPRGGKGMLTFVADGDGPAVIDGTMRLTPANLEATDTKGVYVWRPPSRLPVVSAGPRPKQPMAWMFHNDDWMILVLKREQLDERAHMCFYREPDAVYVNFNGRGIPKDAKLEVAFRSYGFHAPGASNLRIKGFVLRRQTCQALFIRGGNCIVEDCDVIQPNMHGIMTGKQGTYVRRTRVYDSNMWGSNFFGQSHKIEECVFQRCGWRREPAGEPWVGVLKFNGGSFHTVRHNLVIDRTPGVIELGPQKIDRRGKNSFAFGGIWPDLGCMYNRLYGNAIVRIAHAGLYIEHTAVGNLIKFNTIQDCGMGIAFRQAAGNVCRQNWVFDSEAVGLGEVDIDQFPVQNHPGETHPTWGREELDGLCLWHTYITPGSVDNVITENLVQMSGRCLSIPVPTTSSERLRKQVAWIMCVPPESIKDDLGAKVDYRQAARYSYGSPTNNVLNGNYYVPSKKSRKLGFAYYVDKQIETFEEFQKVSGMEKAGQYGEFAPKDIGLQICWTIPPNTKYDRPVAFDYDGGAERHAPPPHLGGERHFFVDYTPQPYSWYRTTGTLDDRLGGPSGLGRDSDLRVWTRWPVCRSGIRALGVSNAKDPKKIAATGVGWRTISVPVKPGTKMKVALYVKASNVQPAQDEGVEIFVHFCDWTGHNVKRSWLIGNGEKPGLAKGTYDWTRLEATLTVPEGVRRMTVYAGLKPGTGSMFIDDLEMSLADFSL